MSERPSELAAVRPPPPRASAAVIATRGTGVDAPLLTVLRSAQLAFFGGYWALPGGALDAADREAARDDEQALMRCAARELLEETGIAVGAPLATRERQALRRELLAGGASSGDRPRWRAFAQRADFAARLIPVCTLTTPPFAPRRFCTRFFHLELRPDEEAVLGVIPGELSEARVLAPSLLLAEWASGRRAVVPPLLGFLDLLAVSDLAAFRATAAETHARLEAGERRPLRQAPGVAMVPLRTPTLPPATTTNCVLVGEERLFIVDPATPYEDETQALVELLERQRAAGRELAGVLVTHHHADHIGAVDAVARRFELPVRAHPETLARLPEPPARAEPLHDGDALALGALPAGAERTAAGGDWKLRAWHTPGHDRGHLVFQESRFGTLIAGDLVSTLSTIVIDPPEGHLATYLESLARVRSLRPGVIVPAHGPSRPNGGELLDEYLRHRAWREGKLVDALPAVDQPPRDETELVTCVYDDVDPRMLPVARRSLVAGLEKLVEQGRACDTGAGWRRA